MENALKDFVNAKTAGKVLLVSDHFAFILILRVIQKLQRCRENREQDIGTRLPHKVSIYCVLSNIPVLFYGVAI